jgi:hypothetical protein
MVRMSDSRVVGRPWNRGWETDWVKIDLAIAVDDDDDDDDDDDAWISDEEYKLWRNVTG